MDAPDAGRLSHIYQLSGFADPVYAEACVTVHDYDIVLEVRLRENVIFTVGDGHFVLIVVCPWSTRSDKPMPVLRSPIITYAIDFCFVGRCW